MRKTHLQRQVWRAFCQPHLVVVLQLSNSASKQIKSQPAAKSSFLFKALQDSHLVQEDYTSAIILGVLPGETNPRLQCQVWNCFSARFSAL